MVEQIKRIKDMVTEAIKNTPKGLTFNGAHSGHTFANEEISYLRMSDIYYTVRMYVHPDGTRRVYMDWNMDVYPDGINFDNLEQEAKTFLNSIDKKLEQWQNQQ